MLRPLWRCRPVCSGRGGFRPKRICCFATSCCCRRPFRRSALIVVNKSDEATSAFKTPFERVFGLGQRCFRFRKDGADWMPFRRAEGRITCFAGNPRWGNPPSSMHLCRGSLKTGGLSKRPNAAGTPPAMQSFCAWLAAMWWIRGLFPFWSFCRWSLDLCLLRR